jgi:hypothetical protein
MQKVFKSAGNWIVSKSDVGIIQGFILESLNGHHKVFIVKCEQDYMVGMEKWLPYSSTTRMGDILMPEDAKELIDIALSTRDEEWFKELCAISEGHGARISRWNHKMDWELA